MCFKRVYKLFLYNNKKNNVRIKATLRRGSTAIVAVQNLEVLHILSVSVPLVNQQAL